MKTKFGHNPGREAIRQLDEELAALGAPRMSTIPDPEKALAKQKRMRQSLERKAKSRIRLMLEKARRKGYGPRECARRSLQIYASLRPAGLETITET